MKFTRWLFISFIIISFAPLFTNAQVDAFHYFTYEISTDSLIGGNNKNYVLIGTVEVDDGYISAGYNKSANGQEVFLIKLGKNGELLWRKNVESSTTNNIGPYAGNQLFINASGNVVLVYYRGLISDPYYSGNVIISEHTIAGDLVNSTVIGEGFAQEPICCTLSPLGDYFISGLDQRFSGQFNEPTKIFVMKVNPLGELIWFKRYYYDIMNKTLPISIMPTSDGNYMIGGDIQEVSNSGENFQHLIIKINEQGDTLWTKRWGNMDFNNGRIFLNVVNDGSVLGTTRKFHPITDYFETYFFTVDNDGNISNEFLFPSNNEGYGYYNEFIFSNSTNYTMLGSSWNENFYQDFSLIKLDSNFSPTSYKRIGYENSFTYYGKDFDRTSDGGFIITGFTLPVGNPPPQKGFLFKIDSLGNYCSAWGCDSVVLDTTSYISYLQEFQESRHTTSTAPNPCSDHFTLSYNLPQEAENCWFRLFDARGIERRSLRLSEAIGSKEVQLSHCEAGIYYWKLVIGNRVIDSGKLVVR